MKNKKENDAEVVEDKTEINETEIKNKCDNSLNIVVITIWISDSSNFFSKKMIKKLCVNLFQSFFAESAVLFSVNLVMLIVSLFFDLLILNVKFVVCFISSAAC